jgi:DNA-binding beta-propeller fold protein YncE
MKKVSGGIGFRDGRLEQALFNGIRQMTFDDEGNLYVGDNGNHCIRKIDTNTNKVETIIGIPQAAGFKDGKKEDALFRNPHGIAVNPDGVIYVSDYGNSRVRRVAVE